MIKCSNFFIFVFMLLELFAFLKFILLLVLLVLFKNHVSQLQVKKKYEIYDINKDQKFLYARELLNFKEKEA